MTTIIAMKVTCIVFAYCPLLKFSHIAKAGNQNVKFIAIVLVPKMAAIVYKQIKRQKYESS